MTSWPNVMGTLECSCLLTGDGTEESPVEISKCVFHQKFEEESHLKVLATLSKEELTFLVVGLESDCLGLEMRCEVLKKLGIDIENS